MAMTECKECGRPISTTAKSCPQCGAKVAHTKWWLWIPLAVFVALVGFGMTIPEYVSRANKVREICGLMTTDYRVCDAIYYDQIRAGEAAAHPQPAPKPYVRSEVEIARDQENDAAQAALDASECKANAAKNLAEYNSLMVARNYWAAAVSIRRCSQVLADQKLASMVADAEVKSYITDIENPRTPKADKIRFVEALLRDYPDRGQKYAPLLPKKPKDAAFPPGMNRIQ